VTALLLEDGATVAEVGEAFGVSRQLAHRFAKEQVQPAD
jgi:transposase-like protein